MKTYTKRTNTEDFPIGSRVRIMAWASEDPNLGNPEGTVIGHDGYTVKIRLDTVTDYMMNYEDTRSGVVDSIPENLVLLGAAT